LIRTFIFFKGQNFYAANTARNDFHHKNYPKHRNVQFMRMNANLKEFKMLNRVLTVAALVAGGVLLSKQLRKSRRSGTMSTIEESIVVNVPVSTAYNQWTQFEDFPKFMDNVREVRQLDETHLHWHANIAGKEEEWDAEITEQIPDKRIAWRSIGGVRNSGAVIFDKISDSATRITLRMEYEPQNVVEKIGDVLGLVRLQARKNLRRFKEMIESRGKETGAWRGVVTHGSVAQH
jgi:uncharacterized membrane protein